MNKQMWNLYRESERGKACIELFNPDTENVVDGALSIIHGATKWGGDPCEDEPTAGAFVAFGNNLLSRDFLPAEWNRETFEKFVTDFNVLDYNFDNDDQIVFSTEEKGVLLASNNFRDKLGWLQIISLILYYEFEQFKPMLLQRRFDIIERNCGALGIELPIPPRTKDYKEYLLYYYDICTAWKEFQDENGLSDAETCACIYDYAGMLYDDTKVTELPKPINVWITGAGKGDFQFLDSLGQDSGDNVESIWACNERTKRGDIIVIYCTSPRSYIHSIWRAQSGGIFNPFDYYHCRTTVCDGILTPQITFNELKADSYTSQVPIVRRNLQGVNGIELSAKDYRELLRLIADKGGNVSEYPKLFEGKEVDFGTITLEKDVEEKILIPSLERLGYSQNDWTRQLSIKAGRKEKAIPDFVFFPKGDKHFESAPLLIEAKLDFSSVTEYIKAYNQGWSYARLLRSTIWGICDKERLVLYELDANGVSDRSKPIFEDHWASIFADEEVGARLNHLIGREAIAGKK